ncbi:MAG: hypothetical protein E7072_02080 [Bacteroidales bacterium]|nr:hypothetical protein [Bacteroidales bacterium]
MKEDKIMKIVAGVAVLLLLVYVIAITCFKETVDYYSALRRNTVMEYVSFRDHYPDSKYNSKINQKKSLLEESYFQRKHKRNTVKAYNEFLHAFPNDKLTERATFLRDSLLQRESDIEKYGKNQLPHGSTPYSSYFGANRECTSKFNSDVQVTAPLAFDMIAVIKEKNEKGKVVSHAYVCADSTYTFKLANGTYQMFFYIGKGWHPERLMEDTILGGFVSYETYSKDNPVTLYNEVITYQLSMKERNRSMSESTRAEMF